MAFPAPGQPAVFNQGPIKNIKAGKGCPALPALGHFQIRSWPQFKTQMAPYPPVLMTGEKCLETQPPS